MSKKKNTRILKHANLYINAGFNNTIMTVTDPFGNVISWSSCGSNGFKGAQKSTPFAAEKTAESLIKNLISSGLKTVDIILCGPGIGKESAVRSISSFVKVNRITDVTPIPHNGCKPRKKRRV